MKRKHISIIAIVFAFGIAGCKKNYLDLETNPNQPSVTTPQLSLTSAEVAAAKIVQTDYNEYGVWLGYWTTSGNYVPNPDINEYNITNGSFATGAIGSTTIFAWDDLYLNLANLNALQNLTAADATLGNFEAIAMILKAYDFEQLVDNYNDVPYSQAFNATIVAPAYDKGSVIYEALGKQLDAAIALINKTASNSLAISPGSADAAFAGDMTGWKKFANSLKLRLALRVYTKTPTDPLVTDLSSTASEGYLDGTTQAAVNPGYIQANSGAGISQESPFYGDYGFDVNNNPTSNNVYYRANQYAVSYYLDNNDPRAAACYSPTAATGAIQGNVFGDTRTTLQNPNTSAVGPGLLQSATQNAVIFSGAESLFLQAEALQDGLGITAGASFATAQAAYEAGITASFVSLGLTAAQATAYYSQTSANVGWASSSNKEQAIITQKWAALNGWSNLEAYNEYRRTGYPALPSSIDPAAVGNTLPSRIFYPTTELTSNTANVAKEGTLNQFTSKIFWAK